MESVRVQCELAGRCSGCEWIELPADEQRARKLSALGSATPPAIAWHAIAPAGLRDKVDLVVTDGGTGLFDRDRQAVLPLPECPQMTPALFAWYADFVAEPPPGFTGRGSVRLRVAPDGARGVWLDFANETIRDLLAERAWLERLGARAVVEIGQRRKRLGSGAEGRLRLGDPELARWTETWDGERVVPLWSTIGSFSQVGHRANRALVDALTDVFPPESAGPWLELGAGNGNFTFWLANRVPRVCAFEQDRLALEGLVRARGERRIDPERIVARAGNFLRPPADLLTGAEWRFDGILADPPRSGLGDALERLVVPLAPRWLLYVSCAADTLRADVARLGGHGYAPVRGIGIDLFPQTPHTEWILLLERRT